MIDTHCHLLPGLDDGPASGLDAIQMARKLAEEEVTLAVCTPHYSRQYPTAHADAEDALFRLRSELDALGIRLELRLAAEFSAEHVVSQGDDQIRARTLGPESVLVELRRKTTAAVLREAVARLTSLGLTPVFAHPERCRLVQRDKTFLDSFRQNGAALQVVVPSLAETSDSLVSSTAWELLDTGRADLVASDAHRSHGPRVRLRAIAELLATKYGRGAAEELLVGGPERILAGSGWIATDSRPVRP